MLEDQFSLIWVLLGLPLAGFLIQALFGKSVVRRFGLGTGKRIMGALAVIPIVGSFGIAVGLTYLLAQFEGGNRVVERTLFDWITVHSLRVPFEVRMDPLSMTMALIVTGVGALIHLYATGYMAEEKDYTRFFTYMNLFIAFMLTLVLGGNLALLFIGWEGVGLCSYLLIGFWYKDLANARAGNKAFIVNRIGDWGLTLGLFLILVLLAGSQEFKAPDARYLSYANVLSDNALQIFRDHPAITTWVALLLFVGAMGKSAQFPLYLWLPDAMAGPTPVSALIHAATMVTAGVFLLNRMAPIFELSHLACAVVAGIGAFTALFAALVAFGQTDIKKVLAYSTVSQLGFMFIACGVGAFWVGMFHVTTHAFFKALLFLGSGAVIHAMAHEQDLRRYGNLIKYLPVTSATMIIGWLAISGFPGLSGFFSKEAILGNALGNDVAVYNGIPVGVIAGWVALGVAVLTAAYMTRLTLLTFGTPGSRSEERWRSIGSQASHEAHSPSHHGESLSHHAHGAAHDEHGFYFSDEEMRVRASHEEHEHHHALDASHEPKEPPISMTFTLVVLAILSVVGGWALHQRELLKHWLAGEGPKFLSPEQVTGHPHGIVGQYLLVMSILAAAAGIAYGFVVYWKGLPDREGWDLSKWSPFRRAAGAQFGYDKLMVDATVEGGGAVATGIWKGFDAGLIDGIVNGVGVLAKGFGGLLRKVQTGYVRGYALLMLLGVVGLLGYFLIAINRVAGGQ